MLNSFVPKVTSLISFAENIQKHLKYKSAANIWNVSRYLDLSVELKYLPWIHNVFWIESFFDLSHNIHAVAKF